MAGSLRVAALACALTAVSLAVAAPAGAIVGGEPDTGHAYVGGIDASPVAPFSTSTGVLISPTVFLTAGHATRRFDAAGLTTARVTFDPVAGSASTWYTGTVHTNPGYDPRNTTNPADFGVIVFASPVPVTPASLPAAGQLGGLAAHQRFDVSAYGVSALLGGADGGVAVEALGQPAVHVGRLRRLRGDEGPGRAPVHL